MERTRYNLIVFLFLFTASGLKAEYRSEIYNAYVNNKMEKWKSVIDRMELLNGKSKETTLELINYQYGYIGYCLEFNKEGEAKKYFSLISKNIDLLEKTGYKPSVISAYKSALYGFRISFNKFSAPFNGPKSLDQAKLALEQDPENYLAYIQYGYAMFNMPAAFGGSKKEALEHYLKAKAILERIPENTNANWIYLKLTTLVAQAYEALEDYTSAKAVYETILQKEPGFTYVRDDLYPELLKKQF